MSAPPTNERRRLRANVRSTHTRTWRAGRHLLASVSSKPAPFAFHISVSGHIDAPAWCGIGDKSIFCGLLVDANRPGIPLEFSSRVPVRARRRGPDVHAHTHYSVVGATVSVPARDHAYKSPVDRFVSE